MNTVSLSHDTDPEAAEAAVRHALDARPDDALVVHLNGFSGRDWRVIAGRLPRRYSTHTPSPNTRMVYVAERAGGFTLSELSGRFDAAGQKVAHAWRVEREAGASILLGTELAHRTRAELLGGDNRYGLLHEHGAGKGETALEYLREDWHVIAHRYVMVWGGGGPGRFAQPAYALAAVLENLHTGQRLAVVQNHDPAHLFPASRFYDPRNMARWAHVMRRQAEAVRQLRQQYHTDAEVVSGDFNAAGPWFVKFMAQHFPGFRPGEGFQFGNAWVHGLRVGQGQTIAPHGSSDHAVKRLRFHW